MAAELSPSPSTPEGTNSVAITSLPKNFFDPLILEMLRTHFANYGEINQWVPLPGFGRIIVVYQEDHSAERAKLLCDPIALQATEAQYVYLRLFLTIADTTAVSKSSCVFSEQTAIP
jgi:Calcipressin